LKQLRNQKKNQKKKGEPKLLWKNNFKYFKNNGRSFVRFGQQHHPSAGGSE